MSDSVWLLAAVLAVAALIIRVIVAEQRIPETAWTRPISSVVAWLLGRRQPGIKASIPDELCPGSNPFPSTDGDMVALSTYRAEPTMTAVPQTAVFTSELAAVFPPSGAPSREVAIDRLGQILLMPGFRPYEPAFAILSAEPGYPVPPPAKPSQVEPPPSWAPWSLAFGEPSFSPPLWGGMLAFLNMFVFARYRGELLKVSAAFARRARLLGVGQLRNERIAELAGKAENAFQSAAKAQEKAYEAASASWTADAAAWAASFKEERTRARALYLAAVADGEPGLSKRIELTLASIRWPPFVFAEGATRFDIASGIVIHEHRFPDPSGVEWVKLVALKSGLSSKPANQRERKEAAARLFPSLCLRLAAEIARLDDDGIVKAVAINGWADYVEKATGQTKRAYCASMFATKEQILALNLASLDPVEAFAALKGISARSLELTPVAPILRLDTSDPRFIDPKEVLANLAEGENLAAMDWEDFEHLCRELFERAFAGSGAEVKVTQASRDQGVDAIVFDPDPLRGGKMVIQAKRYTNTVDVSAVRDLYGAVMNEGAIKGILVTTSHFGAEAYSFAKDKPITLLNGRELLGLLEEHGYKFRIDLGEARARSSHLARS